MYPVSVRSLTIGSGLPKIAVSITGETRAEILSQARALPSLGADLAEWRMDWFSQISDGAAADACLAALREALGPMPLLATFRTQSEGGVRPFSEEEYTALNARVIASGCADLIDLELMRRKSDLVRLIAAAHSAGLPVLLSSHDFEKTPPRRELIRRLVVMQSLGADLLKLAVMPRSRPDVLTLLEAGVEMRERYARVPVITMSMGELGKVSRMCGAFSGSALTFGAAERSSAPGQIPARTLRALLEALGPLSE